ncbi:MAG: cytochrome c biogenesis protein CcsA [Verrucomicrobiota bacterium]
MPNLTDRQWLWLAAACYLAGFTLGTVSLLRGRRHSRAAMFATLAAGFALQTLGLALRGRAVQGCPLGNTFELFQFTAWSSASLFLVVGTTFRVSLLGYFTAMLAAVLTLVSLAVPAWDAAQRTHIFGANQWIELHAALAVFSYGVFGLLAITSAMFLLRNYSLKSKHVGGWFSFLPSILDLDHIGVRLLGAGVALLTASLAVGAVYWLPHPETVNVAKLLATVAVWLAYALALGLRLGGAQPARWLAWECVALFGAALLSLAPVNSSRHPPPTPAASAASATTETRAP